MIRNTFCTLDGIGEKLEKRLWREGVLTWDDFTGADELLGFGKEKKSFLDDCLVHDAKELCADNAPYFSRRIRRREHWRLFDFFKGDAVCLDIETNGLQPNSGGVITVAGFYDGYEYKSLVRGENLSAESLNKELSRHKCLITFYGAVFDIPIYSEVVQRGKMRFAPFRPLFCGKKTWDEGRLKEA